MDALLFLIFAGIAVICAVSLVLQRHPISSALSLVGVMASLAALYLLLGGEFIAAAQLVVYAGAIMVLFIFAIMLLIPGRAESGPDPLARARRLALPVAAVFGIAVLLAAVGRVGGPGVTASEGGVGAIGRLLFTDYLFPFEVTSLLLLAALVGALTLAKRRVNP